MVIPAKRPHLLIFRIFPPLFQFHTLLEFPLMDLDSLTVTQTAIHLLMGFQKPMEIKMEIQTVTHLQTDLKMETHSGFPMQKGIKTVIHLEIPMAIHLAIQMHSEINLDSQMVTQTVTQMQKAIMTEIRLGFQTETQMVTQTDFPKKLLN